MPQVGDGSPRVDAQRTVRLRALSVTDFRNLARVELEIPAAGFVIVGDNGQGKTNLLEAVGYLHALRSMRDARDVELVRFSAAGFHVRGHADGAPADAISVGFERATRRKRVAVDGVARPRLSESLGAVPSLMLSPRDVELVRGAPSVRRRYLDVLLALTTPRYLAALQEYRAALVRRNTTLRDGTRGGAADLDARLAAWEGPLARAGAVLWVERARWVAEMAPRCSALCAEIGEEEPVRLRLGSSLAEDAGPDLDEAQVRGLLTERLARGRVHDIRRGVTLAGPHRDDLVVTLGGRALRTFGSTGQQRSAAIALRLLEGETVCLRTGREPIVLLDDPFAELDHRRAGRVLTVITSQRHGQTLLAVPRRDDIPVAWAGLPAWRMKAGVVTTRGEPADA